MTEPIPHESAAAALRERQLVVITAAYLVSALLLAVWLIQWYSPADLIPGIVLIAAGFLGNRLEQQFGAATVGADLIPMIACAVIAPSMTPFVGATCVALSYPSHRSRLTNTAMLSASASFAGVAALVSGAAPPSTFSDVALAALIASTVFLAANITMAAILVYYVRQQPARDFLRMAIASGVASTFIAGVPLVLLVVSIWMVGGNATLPLVVTPILLVQYFLSLYQRKVQLTEDLAEKAQVLARTNLQFAAAMVKALDQRDAYTAGHSAAVAVYTRDIAREMGFDDETIRLAHLSGLLHDIGKIGVPGRVLNKTSPLDDEEYELMKTHAAMGAEILGEVDLYADIAILVRYHHERIDGRGYPDGIAGDAIPAISRMISVADTYSAMTTDRPYREGMPTEKAMSILRECRGTQLDQDFTDAFLRILIVADAAYQRGKQTDFEVEVAKHQALSEVEAEAVRVNAPSPAGPEPVEMPKLPAATEDGELIEVDLDREAA